MFYTASYGLCICNTYNVRMMYTGGIELFTKHIEVPLVLGLNEWDDSPDSSSSTTRSPPVGRTNVQVASQAMGKSPRCTQDLVQGE